MRLRTYEKLFTAALACDEFREYSPAEMVHRLTKILLLRIVKKLKNSAFLIFIG
jgi:hypothetical protein